MTLAIGVSGKNAGSAVFEAMKAVEKIASGSIGGFATFTAISFDGLLYRSETQRGGSSTLFSDGIKLLCSPPPEVAKCPFAAIITSGPDRLPPLSKFITADPHAGIVTGHRSPHTKSIDGEPLNVEILEMLKKGKSPQIAVDTVLDRNPQSDAGFIALDITGNIYSRNSARVDARPDVGVWRISSESGDTKINVLHNAMFPSFSRESLISHLAAEIALSASIGIKAPTAEITLKAGVSVELGTEDAVYCTRDGYISKVVTADPFLVSGQTEAALLYLGTSVFMDGEFLGRIAFEPLVTLENGVVVRANGKEEIVIFVI